jgi:CheY-like chemotaxis protein
MKTVLVIEDNLEIRENTAELLELAGYRVIVADNGKEGLVIACSHSPDLILCDIMMPGMDGYQVIKEIRENPRTSKIPFIYITARAEKADVKIAMNLSADGYVKKPFDIRELIEAIESVTVK